MQAICRIVVQRHCNAIRIDATDTEFVTVAKPGNKTNQFWTLAATFSVSEKKKIEMDFVTFIGFLATSQVFKADGWFMVLQGSSRALWSY